MSQPVDPSVSFVDSREVTLRGAFTLFAQRLNRDLRDWRYHLFIFGLSFIQFFQLVFVAGTSNFFTSSAPGLRYLQSWGQLMLNVIIFVGTQFCVRLIAEEKEQGTLGLLKLTGIGPFGILVGLFGSRLFQILTIITLQLPFIVWAVTLGGVTFQQVISLFLTLMAAILLVGNLGLYTSIAFENVAAASRAAYFFLFLYPISIGLLNVIISAIATGSITFSGAGVLQAFFVQVLVFLQSVSPYTKLTTIFTTGYSAPHLDHQVGVFLFVALGFFCLSIYRFERFSSQTDPVPAGAKRFSLPTVSLPFRRTGSRRSLRCWDNPYVWREFQFLLRGFRGWSYSLFLAPLIALFVFGVLPFVLIQRGFSERDALDYARGFGGFWMIAATGALCVAPGLYMSSVLTAEFKQQTLATLFLVSRPATSILRGLMFGRFLIIGHIFIWLITGTIGFLIISPPDSNQLFPDGSIFIRLPLLILLSVPVWLSVTGFLAVVGLRLDFVRSMITKGLVLLFCLCFGLPVGATFFGLIIQGCRGLSFYFAVLYISILFVVVLGVFTVITLAIWESILEAIRDRMAES